MRKILAVLIVFSIFFLVSVSHAEEVTKITWDAVTTDIENNPITITGYKPYCKTSGSYADVTPIDAGNVTEILIGDVIGDSADNKWYCVLTAYIPNAESAYSNEVIIIRSAGLFYRPGTPKCPCTLNLE